MIETFSALLLAHALADFVLQTRWIATHKANPLAMLIHTGTVLVPAVLATGSAHPILIGLAAVHMAIDLGKLLASRTLPKRHGLALFLTDQALHLASLMVIAQMAPDLWSSGLYGALSYVPALMTLVSGLIIATRAGGFALGILMEPWSDASPHGLPNGGRAIGHLERGLIFLLILSDLAAGIGFLIAAKSVLRFGSVGDDRALSEYVIIGTLASFGWAIVTSTGTVALLSFLTPLGIPDLSH
jgi:hypothetical protein